MKFRTYITLFLAVFSSAFFLASCLNEDNKIPDNCYDGVLNNGEINIDCGGPNCEECDHCTNGVFEPERGETWVDCGGECPVCPTCANGDLDPGEIGIDCGGVCGGCELLCDEGLYNGLEALGWIDCELVDDNLQPGGCPICPNCEDDIMNGTEIGIDCGGDSCSACCSTGNCTNGIQDGVEFYVDCGGNSCPDCDTIFVFEIGSTEYYTPQLIVAPTYVQGPPGVVEYTLMSAFENDPDAPLLELGNLSITLTESAILNWTSMIGSAIDFPSVQYPDDDYSIDWFDLQTGYTYSTSTPGASGRFTILKYKSLEVTPQDEVNGCNKPQGLYTFFRVSFEGTLLSADPTAPSPSANLESGLFQFTFYTP
jgi:hypothetical protein